MKTVKKIMSVIMIGTLITSQIGCAGKVTKISEPMDQVKFDKGYRYEVKLKNGNSILNLDGERIKNINDHLQLKIQSEENSINTDRIQQINGVSKNKIGNNAKGGFLIGAGIVGTMGLVLSATSSGFSSDCTDCGASSTDILGATLIGGLIGGLVGAGIGSLIPVYQRIEITPIIEPTKTGSINVGANLGVTF